MQVGAVHCQCGGALTGSRAAQRRAAAALRAGAPVLYTGPAMNFALTPQMIDKIGFAMEDQKEQFAADVETGELVALSSLGAAFSDERYARLPRWGSAEGFHLMESFVTSLDNPAYREQLSKALTMGRGVFRAYKDVLKRTKEIEKLWFAYKEQRLRAVIVSWYNANREARGLARLPEEPEETEELVMSDFSFEWGPGSHLEEILRMDRDTFFELFPLESSGLLEERYSGKRSGLEAPGQPKSPVLIAETPAGELAGVAWGAIDGRSVHIVQLAVAPGLRGIGLGEALLRQFLTGMRAQGMQKLTTELTGKSLRFSDFFQSVGFRPVATMMECSLGDLPF
jgi:ribosomal protein S18 acetylase RimI-like enzyme